MKKILLIYDRVDVQRNQWFIGELIFYGKSKGLEILVQAVDDGEAWLDLSSVDVVINRSRFSAISKRVESAGVPVVNNEKTTLIGNDKYLTYLFCKDLSVPVLNTELLNSVDDVKNYPTVVKTVDGHGGKEVFLVKDEAELRLVKSKLEGKRLIFQAPSRTFGEDCRVYLLGSEVLCSVLRSSGGDFKSNFSLGGSASVYSLDGKYLEQARAIAESLDSDFIGVDFIKDGEDFILNEIEDCVGSRMLYALTDINVARLFIERVYEKYIKVGQ